MVYVQNGTISVRTKLFFWIVWKLELVFCMTVNQPLACCLSELHVNEKQHVNRLFFTTSSYQHYPEEEKVTVDKFLTIWQLYVIKMPEILSHCSGNLITS